MGRAGDFVVNLIQKIKGSSKGEVPDKREAVGSPETLSDRDDVLQEMDSELREKDAKLEDLKAQQQREEKSQDKEDITRKLHKQQKQLRNKDLENAISLQKLHATDETIDVVGIEGKKFGEFKDTVIDEKGMIHLLSKNQGSIMQAPSYDRMFAHPKKLHRELEKGMITICKLDNGGYHKPEHSVEVPKMIWTPEDGVIQADHSTEKYIEQVSQLKRQNSMLNSKLAAMERSVVKMANYVEEQDRLIGNAEEMHDNVKNELERKNSEMQNIINSFDDMQTEMRRKNAEKGMWEKGAKALYGSRDEMVSELVEKIDKEDVDIAKEEIQKMAGVFDDLISDRAEKQSSAVPQSQNQEIEDTGAEMLEPDNS